MVRHFVFLPMMALSEFAEESIKSKLYLSTYVITRQVQDWLQFEYKIVE
jgi:hypothetical protein